MNGRLDMGMIPARAWDTEKVTSLRALQAPFLVNSDALAKQVVTADMAGEMLAGLDRAGVTGLALVPESTRQIFAFGKPLLSPADLKGKTVRVPRSDTSYALFRALGATPSDVDALQDRFVGAESSFELARNLPETTVTATGNLTLFSKVNSVVINSKRFAALDQAQQGVLRDAATATRDWGVKAMPATADEAKRHCQNGHTVVLATPADLAAFQRAAQPVYADLEKDAQTKALIAGIRGLASRTAPPPPVAACGPAAAVTPSVQPAAGTFPDGVYRKTVSEQAMLAAGVSGRDAKDHAGLWTMTFDKGIFTIQQRGYPAGRGVYCLSDGKITVAEGRTRCGGTDGRVIFTATWQLDNDQLRFTPTGGDNDAPPGTVDQRAIRRRTVDEDRLTHRGSSRLAVEGELGGQRRPGSRPGIHPQRAADRLHPVHQTQDAGAARDGRTTHPVVGHRDEKNPGPHRHIDPDRRRLRVFRHVGESLGAQVVGRRLDLRVETPGRHRQLHRNGAAARQRRHRRGQAAGKLTRKQPVVPRRAGRPASAPADPRPGPGGYRHPMRCPAGHSPCRPAGIRQQWPARRSRRRRSPSTARCSRRREPDTSATRAWIPACSAA